MEKIKEALRKGLIEQKLSKNILNEYLYNALLKFLRKQGLEVKNWSSYKIQLKNSKGNLFYCSLSVMIRGNFFKPTFTIKEEYCDWPEKEKKILENILNGPVQYILDDELLNMSFEKFKKKTSF